MNFSPLIFLLVITSVLATDFDYDFEVKDEDSGEHLITKSKGTLKKIISLDRSAKIRHYKCLGNDKILVNARTIDQILKWSAGSLIKVPNSKNCIFSQQEDENFIFNLQESEIYRKLVSSKRLNDHEVLLKTKATDILDYFDNANILHSYKSGIRTASRSKRAIKKIQTAFADLRKKFQNINYTLDHETNVNINYDLDKEGAKDKWGIYNGAVQFNKVDVQEEIDEEPTGENKLAWNMIKSLRHKSHPDVKFQVSKIAEMAGMSVECSDCYFHLHSQLLFKLLVDVPTKLRDVVIQIEGDLKTRFKFDFDAFGDVSYKRKSTIWKSDIITLMDFPIIPGILNFKPKLQVFIDQDADIKLNAGAKLGIDFSANGRLTSKFTYSNGKWNIDNNFSVKSLEPNFANDDQQKLFESEFRRHISLPSAGFTMDFKLHLRPIIIFDIHTRTRSSDDSELSFSFLFPVELELSGKFYFDAIIHFDLKSCIDSRIAITGNIHTLPASLKFSMYGLTYSKDNLKLGKGVTKDNGYKIMPEKRLTDISKCSGVSCSVNNLPFQSKGLDDVIGQGDNPIVRNTGDFNELIQIDGAFMLFRDTPGSTDTSETKWCGNSNFNCPSCVSESKGSGHTSCGSRMANARLVAKLNRLALLIKWEFQANRKLYVLQAWFEPSWNQLDNTYPKNSPYREGRAAKITLTKELNGNNSPITPPEAEVDNHILQRVAELAVCSGFDFVRLQSEFVEVGVIKVKSSNIFEKSRFDEVMQNIHNFVNKLSCSSYPKLSKGSTYPDGQTIEESCGAQQQPIPRDADEFMERLYLYATDDVEFSCEETSEAWCGFEDRKCSPCSINSLADSIWRRPADRVMSPQLAERIKKLASLVKRKWTDRKLKVLEAWDEPTEKYPDGKHSAGSLHYEGRAAQLTLTGSNPNDLHEDLSQLAICSGFHHIYHDDKSVNVFVGLQKGYTAVFYPFTNIILKSVWAPIREKLKYALPEGLEKEERQPELFDARGSLKKKIISGDITISDFVNPASDYFRADEQLLEYVQNLKESLKSKVKILKGYLNKQVNSLNKVTKHAEELIRHQSGQAIELQIGSGNFDELLTLGKKIIKQLGSVVQKTGRKIGLGLHKNSIYFDLRPQIDSNVTNVIPDFIETWCVSDANEKLCKLLVQLKDSVQRGFPSIDPIDELSVCNPPNLGVEKHYFNTQKVSMCLMQIDTKFCKETRDHRKNVLNEFLKDMRSKLGNKYHAFSTVKAEVSTCLLDACGVGCDAKNEKLSACSTLVKKAVEFMPPTVDNLSFFNAHNTDSTVHGLACKNHLCIEEIPLYLLMEQIVQKLYSIKKKSSIEERLYGHADNPLPIIEQLEQEIAYRAEGSVNVYIESETDLSLLRPVIKNLMVLAKKVTEITFHVREEPIRLLLEDRLYKWANIWSSSSCPQRSRDVITPYKIEEISSNRHKRSIIDSEPRNRVKREIGEWEMAWIDKLNI